MPDFAETRNTSSGSHPTSSASSRRSRQARPAAGRSCSRAGTITEPGVAGQVEVRQGLRLDALGRVHQQDGSLAGGQAPGDLVGEVHVPRRVDQVQLELGPRPRVARRTAWALIVIPRSRSRSIRSRYCSRIRGPPRRGSGPGIDRPGSTCRGRCGPRCRSCGSGRSGSRRSWYGPPDAKRRPDRQAARGTHKAARCETAP